MKKSLLVALLCAATSVVQLRAQNVNVNGSVGADGTYPTVGAAFTAINANVQTGASILISIVGNTTETATATLNQGTWAQVTIFPAGGAARLVQGNITGHLIDFNGADRVSVDGLNTGGNSLTIENQSTGASSSTIRFINDAHTIAVQNATVLGANPTATCGTIFFSTGTTTGNDTITINQCTIDASGANFPINGIYSSGTNTAGQENSAILISNNNIANYFNAASASAGVLFGTGNTFCSFIGNRFYQSATRQYTTANTHFAISITSGSAYTIQNNIIGFANAAGTGTYSMTGNSTALAGFPAAYTSSGTANATRFTGINAAFTAGGPLSLISGNTIAGIALYSSSGASTTNGVLGGIVVTAGNATISGNTIGATSGTGSLYLATTTSGGVVSAIYGTSANTLTITGNTIGAIDASGTTASQSGGFKGIDVAGNGSHTITNNIIGNSTANNIRVGYFQSGANLSNAGTPTSTTGSGPVQAILCSASGTSASITGNTLRGIQIANTSGAFTGINNTGSQTTSVSVSGNFLGTAGLGLLNYAFANSGAFTGITLSGSGSATSHAISNNDIQGITYAAASSHAVTLIFISGATAANDVATISGNTFTNLNLNTTGSLIFISHNYIIAATGQLIINNNSIVTGFTKSGAGGTNYITYSNSTSGTGAVNNYTNNNFSNITLTGATPLNGIQNTDGGAGATKTITGNTFSNWTCGTSAINVINIAYWNGASAMSSNVISNITGQGSITGINMGSTTNNATSIAVSNNTISGLTSTGAGGAVTGLSCSNTSTGIVISGNTINTLSSTASTTVAGIIISGAPAGGLVVTRNKVYDVSGSNAGATITGVNVSGGTLVTLSNNIIGDIRNTAANTANALIGISVTGGTTVNAYYNTVYLNATSVGANFGSSGISTVTGTTLDLRNNLVINLSTPTGTGITAAYRRSSTTLTSYAGTSNSNSFYAGTPSATRVIMTDGTNSYQTLAAYKTAMGSRDASSLSENPTFVSLVGANAGYLHIPAATATPLESGGIVIAGLTVDYDNDVRPGPAASVNGGGTIPDIGADEFDGAPVDAVAPLITYTSLAATCAVTDRVLTATITDATGVPTTGALQPRIYYRKNAGPWFSSQGVMTTGTATNGTWDFTIISADMGGVSGGDAISYYVIAQDVVGPYISSNASGAVATDVNTVTTAPAAPASYLINYTLNGTYTVGTTGNFTTLTAAVNAYNASCLTGPVVFSLIDATYPSETFPITVLNHPSASSVNTLTIKPAAGVSPSITGSNAVAILRLNGTDYVTIDGSNAVNGTTRDLTIRNTNTGTSSITVWISCGSATDAATNNTVKNCVVMGNASTTTLACIMTSGTAAGGVAEIANTNNAILNNAVSASFYGVGMVGSATNDAGNSMSGNLIGSTVAANKIGFQAMFIAQQINIVAADNIIAGVTYGGINNPNCAGIYVAGTMSGGLITRNQISDIKNTNTGGYGAYGICLNSGSANTGVTVSNNFISDVAGVGWTSQGINDNGYGMVINSGGGYSIYYNTVVMNTNQTLLNCRTTALWISGTTGTGLDIRNNIFANLQTVSNANQRHAVYCAATSNAIFSNMNNNVYYTTGNNLGNINSTQCANLTAFQTNFGGNANSDVALPVFVSATDLHLVAGSNPLIEDKAAILAGVTIDIDNQARNTCSPDIGADEFGTPREINVTGNSVTIVDGDVTPVGADHTSFGSMSVCNGTNSRTYTIQNTGTTALTISSATITGTNASDFTITTAATSPVPPAGSTTIVVTFDPSASGVRSATLTINTNDCDEAAYDFTIAGMGTQIAASLATQTNLNCNGDGSGSAAVNVTGGVAPITYLWSPAGGTAATASGLSAGSYTCTATDANGCTSEVFVTLTEPTAVTASISATTDVTCNTGTDGAATVVASGGTGSYTYAWTPSGGTSATETGLAAGSYTCTVSDVNGCTATAIATITEPAAITASVTSQTDAVCNSTLTGAATVTASGGTGVLTYAWAPSGGNAATATGLGAGTYTCTITDASGCTNQQMATINEPAAIITSIASQTDVTCNSAATGSATISASGGTGAFTYAWAPSGGNAATATGLAAGTYTCTVTDANACTQIQVVTITEPSAITSSITAQTDAACNSAATGSATISASGGTGVLTYAWAPTGGTTSTASNLAAGTYTCTITDANGCTHDQVVTITEPSAITSSIASQTNVTCNSAATGAATVSASGGTGVLTYAWTPSGGNAATATGLMAGTYTCTITDANACTHQQVVTITEPSAITSSITSQTNVTCNSAATGAATVSASGGTGVLTYAWTPSGGNAATATGLMAGTYTCTITDANSCTHQQVVTITEPSAISSSVVSQTNVACNSAATGSATILASGGTGVLTYAWAPTGGTTPTASGLMAGTYTCTITDANGCTQQEVVTITEPSAITSSVVSVTDATCGNNNGDITITAAGGTGVLTYAWAPAGGTAATATGLIAGTYTCTISDANGCTQQQIASVSNIGGPVVSVASHTDVSCNSGNDGAVTLNVTGASPFTYAWAPTGGTAATATGLTAGTYTCTVTDDNGCIQNQTVTITQPGAIVSSAVHTNVSCNGGSNGTATVTASGGTGVLTYVWAPAGGTAASATGLTAGTYTCTITDANSCTYQQTVTVTEPAAITASISSSANVSCNSGNNGSASVSASGGTGVLTYAWAPAGGTAATATGLIAGTYTVTITDANGCTQQQNVTITQPAAITSSISASSDVSCNAGNNGSATVSASGGTGAFTYAWAPAGGTAATATGLSAGTYTCTITDANACTHQQTVTITQPTAITSSISASTNVSCNGGSNGSATVSASGGTGAFTYAWAPGGGTAATATGLASGNYTCTITDANGCTHQQTVTITQPSAITSSVSSTDVSCNGGNNGSLTVTASGGTGVLTYAWAPSGGTAATATGLAAGTYTCTITDANGCTHQQAGTVAEPSAVTVSLASSSNVSCNSGSNGSATVSASGGTGVLTYAWTPSGGTAATATGLSAGTYTCTVTDVNGCTAMQTVTITQPTAVTASVASVTDVSCNAGNNGSISVIASGGTGALTYAWAPAGGNASTASSLTSGTYTCTITDANGCTATATATVTQPTAITSSITSSASVSCNGGNDGAATVSASGGTGVLTYAWTPSGGTAATATGLSAGTYTCTITDANSCTHQQTVTITEPSAVTASISSQTNVTCNSGNDGVATVTAAGGTGVLTYAWAPSGGNAATATGLAMGTYTVTVTDANSCTASATVSITQPSAITSSVSSVTDATCGNNNGTATVSATGGTGVLTYSWAPTGGNTATGMALGAGGYTVTITDAAGCTHTQFVAVSNQGGPTVAVTASANVSCNGGNNGTASVTVIGGTGTLTYDWTGSPAGDGTPSVTGLAQGVYVCTVTDQNACIGTATVTITEPSAITSSISASTNVSCNAGNNGSATVTASGGTGGLTYAWAPTGGNSATATGLIADTYTCTITDANGCTHQQTVTITQPTAITSSVTVQTDASCNGGNDGAATIASSGGTGAHTYLWSSGSTTDSETDLAAGTYTVTITDANGCTAQQVVSINEPSAVTASVTASTNVTCFGGNDGAATVTASGGTGLLAYAWAPAGGTAATATGLTADTYTCTVTDQNGCSTTATVTLTEPVQVTVNANVTADTVCFGTPVTFTGSGTATSYTWTGGVTDAVPFTPSVTDTYTVTGTDLTGCTNTATITVVVNALPSVTANAAPAAVCNGEQVTFTGSGTSTSYVWSGGVTDAVPFVMTASGTFTVTGTDANGCSDTASIAVTVNPLPVVNLGADQAVCSATVTLDAQNAGDTYLWSDSTTAQTLVVAATGTYWVDVTNTSGCTTRDSVMITINTNPVVTLGADTAICGPSLMLDAGMITDASYLWSDSTTAQSLTAMVSGTYFVTVTDTTTGCAATDSINVVLNPAVVVTLGPDTTQCGGSVTLDAGMLANASYMWSDSTVAQTLTVSNSGNYSVIVTDTTTGCWGTDSINVTINNVPVVNLGSDTAQCGGTVTLDAGPFLNVNFMWSDSTTAQTLTVTTSGNYSVIVTDTATGCAGTDSVNVTINTIPVVTFSLSQDTICDLDADLVLSGAPIGGSFAGPGVTGNSFDPGSLNGVQVITYTYTDTNGCFSNAMDSIVVDPCTGIEDNNGVVFGMNVYPNPNYGHFFIELNYVPTDVVTIEVTNALGQVVQMIQTSSALTEIDIQMYEGGVYNVRVIDGGTVFIGRIVKE